MKIELENDQKILALDVEGTIITGYDYENPYQGENFPALIDKNLKFFLAVFKRHDYKIVLATGTSDDNLDYYENEFERYGFHKYIDSYSPTKHSPEDSKSDKLTKYASQFSVSKENIYFFDDAKQNIANAITDGFTNSTQVIDENTLAKRLKDLLITQDLIKDSGWETFPPEFRAYVSEHSKTNEFFYRDATTSTAEEYWNYLVNCTEDGQSYWVDKFEKANHLNLDRIGDVINTAIFNSGTNSTNLKEEYADHLMHIIFSGETGIAIQSALLSKLQDQSIDSNKKSPGLSKTINIIISTLYKDNALPKKTQEKTGFFGLGGSIYSRPSVEIKDEYLLDQPPQQNNGMGMGN